MRAIPAGGLTTLLCVASAAITVSKAHVSGSRAKADGSDIHADGSNLTALMTAHGTGVTPGRGAWYVSGLNMSD